MHASLRRFLPVLALLAFATAAADTALPDDPAIVGSRGFLAAHPDIRYREQASTDYRAKRYRAAFGAFKDAARYADKTSQAMVAEMLWNGEGTAVDKPLAYAWIDLAAERGYTSLIALRERYWSELDAAQRAQAIRVGEAVYAEYGDDVAKPRLERELRSTRLAVTGSHLGHVGTLGVPGKLHMPPRGASGAASVDVADFGDVVDGSRYFDARYWEPAQYWKWQDQQWRNADPHVEVGAPQALDAK